jgi:Ca2+-binding RTX toxin-like protein
MADPATSDPGNGRTNAPCRAMKQASCRALSRTKSSGWRRRRIAITVGIGLVVATGGSVARQLAVQASTPTCFGKPATPRGLGTAGDDTIVGTSGNDVLIGLGGNDTIYGLGGNDLICGGDGNDVMYGGGGADNLSGGAGADGLQGGAGADTLQGGTGLDTAYFNDLSYQSPVTANLSTGTATSGGVTDKLSGIEAVVGTPGPDHLTGSPGVDFLFGIGGDDAIDGAGGFDYAGFFAPVTASLLAGTANGEGSDGLKNIEGLIAAVSPSTLIGDDNPNVLWSADTDTSHTLDDTLQGNGGNDLLYAGPGNDHLYGDAGDDTLAGGMGDDTINGGDGSDTSDYSSATGPVNVNLSTGTSSGADGTDALSNLENAIGSDFNDVLHGNAAPNGLQGRGGGDMLYGGGGKDYLDGGPGTDTGYPGNGTDACTAVEVLPSGCEIVVPQSSPTQPTSRTLAGLASQLAKKPSARHATAIANGAPYDYLVNSLGGGGDHCFTSDQPGGTAITAYAPSVGSIDGNFDTVWWTPYFYYSDNPSDPNSWNLFGHGYTHTIVGVPNTASGQYYEWEQANFVDNPTTDYFQFTVNSGNPAVRVANYIEWNQDPSLVSFTWGGWHYNPYGVLGDTYAYPYCQY